MFPVAAKPLVSHAFAHRAVPPFQRQHRLDAQVGQLVENLVGGVGAVVVPNPGVVAPEHVVGAAHILPHQCVEHRLSGPRVPHVPHQRGRLVYVGPYEPAFPQLVVAQDYGLVDVVARFLFADNCADEDSLRFCRQVSALHHPLVSGVGHVAGLVRDNLGPAQFSKTFPQLPGCAPEPVVGRVYHGRIDQSDGAGDESVLKGVGAQHARMGFVGGAVNVLHQELLVVRENFLNLQHRQWLVLVSQQDRCALSDTQG